MMFPHIVTIYHYDVIGKTENYTKQIIQGAYVQEKKAVAKEGKGIKRDRSVTVTFSVDKTNEFNNKWTCKEGDRLVIGKGKDINKFADIPDAYIIKEIQINKSGGLADNIVLVGD